MISAINDFLLDLLGLSAILLLQAVALFGLVAVVMIGVKTVKMFLEDL